MPVRSARRPVTITVSMAGSGAVWACANNGSMLNAAAMVIFARFTGSPLFLS